MNRSDLQEIVLSSGKERTAVLKTSFTDSSVAMLFLQAFLFTKSNDLRYYADNEKVSGKQL